MKFRLAVAALGCALMASCVYSGGFNPMANTSEVELAGNNFEVTAVSQKGQASCAYLFGLIPLGDPAVATRAMDDLVATANIEQQSRGLVNFSSDNRSSWYVFVTVRSVTVRADVVEFR